MRDDEPLSEFTSETTARSNVEASVTAGAGSAGLRIAPGHLLNFTVHERTSIPSASPAHLHASARRELFDSLTAQVRRLRARVARLPEIPMWIGQSRNLRRLSANTALTFAGGIATGVLIMWFASAQPSTIVSTATPAAGTRTCGLGDGTSRIASRCALGAGNRQSSSNVATTRDRLSCCHERPPESGRGSTRQTLARDIDSGCHPQKCGTEFARHAHYVAWFLSGIARYSAPRHRARVYL